LSLINTNKHFVITAYSLAELLTALEKPISANLSIGLVPTMGALHEGHASLVTTAKKLCNFVIATVFVNPTQFTNQDDLTNYPKTESKDIALLESLGCDLVFFPSASEIYSSDYHFPGIELGFLDQTMEGNSRPGHFQGVCQVVYRLFELTKPNKAFFGLKDFQQVSVIQFMVNHFKLPIEIIPCETSRNKEGLALSSRNLRLSEQQKTEALILYKTLLDSIHNAKSMNPIEVKKIAEESITKSELKLEYVEIVNPITLENLDITWSAHARMCIVAYAGEVRLIDNMEIRE
jgi:pantoate--beta-alanine ligase